MCKRPVFLISIVLVLSLSGAVLGQGDINVVNPSFEWADEVNLVTCHQGLADFLGWSGGAELGATNPDWSGVDVNCGWSLACEDCRDWHVFPDGNVVAYMDMGTFIYQLTDANITEGYEYTLTFPSVTWIADGWSQPIRASFYYLDDVCAPDVNHNEISQTIHFVEGRDHPSCEGMPDCVTEWEYGLEAKFVAESGADYLNEKLGIKFGSPYAGDYPGSSWAWLDDVHLSWDWATEAYNPNPGDGEKLVTKNPTLSWSPGVYVADTGGHEIYFGTDETAVADANSSNTTGILESDVCDVNSYTPTHNPLELGMTYYWKITEVNQDYNGPLTPPWEGDVWSFRVEGHAHDPSPYNGESEVEFLGLELEWTAGAEAERHLVYFGTSAQAVEDATTSSDEYEANLPAADVNHAISAQLQVQKGYFWRVDEVSTSPTHTVKGDVWGFTVGTYLVVDNFESYTNDYDLWQVWDDYFVNESEGAIYTEVEPNLVHNIVGTSAQMNILNDSKIGSWYDVQDMAELNIGSDWTVGGVKALRLYLRGDPCNVHVVAWTKGQNPEPIWDSMTPWVELEDTSSNSGYVLYSSPVMASYDGWFQWDINLGILDACGVDLSALDRFTVGIGGADKAGQASKMSGTGYMYLDDIRLYPPLCYTKYAPDGDFTDDCNVDFHDVNYMSTGWLWMDGEHMTENRPATLTGFPDDHSHWTTDCAVGSGAIKVNDGCDIKVTDPRFVGTDQMSITAWIKPIEGMEKWVGIVSSRERAPGCGDDASEIGVYGKAYGGPDGLGYDWSCGTEEWQWDAGVDITDNVWTFVALTVDPCGASLYKRELPEGGLQEGIRNEVRHEIQANFEDHFVIGSDDKGGYFQGAIDDVRLYAYALDWNDVNMLAYGSGEPNPAPVYRYQFEETTGYTAADSGTPQLLYGPVPSRANMTDPEPKLERILNFRDFALFADNWMDQKLWPVW